MDAGALMAGVCRGKFSEGLDFSDNAGWTVIMIGIPYLQKKDICTILKKKQFENKGLSRNDFWMWNHAQAAQAIN